MDKMLTQREQRHIENLLSGSKQHDPVMRPGWGPWVSFALGGFLIVFACFTTLSNMNITTIKYVLVPGIFCGLVLLMGGLWAQHISRKTADDKLLAGILKKLLA